MNEIEQGKQTAIVSYLTIIGSIIAIFMNSETKNSFCKFSHSSIFGNFSNVLLLGYPVGYFDSWMITASFWTFIFILWLFGFMNALNGEQKPVPFLGELYQKLFKSF